MVRAILKSRFPQSMSAFPTYVDLSKAMPIAEGHKRSVYEVDFLPGMLIKVVRPEHVTSEGQLTLPRPKAFRPFRVARRLGAFNAIMRELKEFLAFAVKPGNRNEAWPIQRFWGFIDTNFGLGLIVEKLTAPDGSLAPTVEQLIDERRFTPAHRAALVHLFEELARLHLCIGSMHERNIVLVGEIGNGGRFIGVDGLGDKAFIPLADLSKRFNAYEVRRRARILLDRVDRRLATGAPATENRRR